MRLLSVDYSPYNRGTMQVDILLQLADALSAAYSDAALGELTTEEATKSLSFCDIEFGDFASNIAMQRAKEFNQNPRHIAEAICLKLQGHSVIATAEVAGPGFLNIRLQDSVWHAYLLNLDDQYLFSQAGKGTSVNIEFISANPTGPLVLVNAWNGFYGDVLARLYASQGYGVTREYYLNDGGNQIAQLGRAVQQAAGAVFAPEVSEVLYRGSYIDELSQRMADQYGGNDAVQALDPAELGNVVQKIILAEYIQPTLKRLGITFDEIYPESILDNASTVQRLESAQAISRHDGAIWLDAEKAGLDKDEVLIRSTDNLETYFLKDISYQYGKLVERGFDRAITIVGPDHHGQEKRLVAALDLLGVSGFVPLWTQTVRLIKDGVEYKMSKRRGNFIPLDDFLDAVPVETARFFFAMRDTNTHFDLNLDVVTAQNKHNPLYYVMYAYVRMVSVLQKAEENSIDVSLTSNAQTLPLSERALLRKTLELRQLVVASISTHQVHPVLHALIEFAGLFHDWYEQNPVLKADVDVRSARLSMIFHLRNALRGTLELIGITPQERME
ncbi:arginine--tRNA ligase [Patescibacteria group bacterium]|nr:MAG: arginine--tRNA ligase [Patescibacteria group bacterium]